MNDLAPLPYKALSPSFLELLRAMEKLAALGDYTQPMTIAECDAARAFRQQAAKDPYVPSTPIDDGPNPGEMGLDWLAINREFS